MRKRGFTLIELLVVISIIAMLLAILMPSLRSAKNLARVTVCMANLKQIGSIAGAYEAGNDDKVPIMFSRGTWAYLPAKHAYPSLAFENYVQLKKQPSKIGLDPDVAWTGQQPIDYAEECVPKFFVCPFNRNTKKPPDWIDSGSVTLGTRTIPTRKITGYEESYFTWYSPGNSYRDWLIAGNPQHPFGSEYGFPKYEWVNWYNSKVGFDPISQYSEVKQISFSSKYANVSRKTTMLCGMGESLTIASSNANDFLIRNYDSHRKKGHGGSNAIFGDHHVEWVRGSQIGWY